MTVVVVVVLVVVVVVGVAAVAVVVVVAVLEAVVELVAVVVVVLVIVVLVVVAVLVIVVVMVVQVVMVVAAVVAVEAVAVEGLVARLILLFKLAAPTTIDLEIGFLDIKETQPDKTHTTRHNPTQPDSNRRNPTQPHTTRYPTVYVCLKSFFSVLWFRRFRKQKTKNLILQTLKNVFWFWGKKQKNKPNISNWNSVFCFF